MTKTPLTFLCFFLFVAGIGLFLAEMWFHVWSDEVFFKLAATDVAVFTVCFVWAFLVKENKESEKIDKGNTLH